MKKLYTKKQLKHAFEAGAIVKENLLNRKTNKRNFDLEEQFGYFLKNVLIKDNPVPSLDKNFKKIVNHINTYDEISQIDKLLIENFIKKLQNGVETTKEQSNSCGRKVVNQSCTIDDCDYPDCEGDNY